MGRRVLLQNRCRHGGRLWCCRQGICGRLQEHLDKVDAALPALEAALVDARLDIVGAEAGGELVALAGALFIVIVVALLRHELHLDIPQLSPWQAEPVWLVSWCQAAVAGLGINLVQGHIQQAVGNLGRQLCQHLLQVMALWWELWLALDRESTGSRCGRCGRRLCGCRCSGGDRRGADGAVVLYIVAGERE